MYLKTVIVLSLYFTLNSASVPKLNLGNVVDGDIKDFPYLVSIRSLNYNLGRRIYNKEKFLCAGSLITTEHVLTTDKCLVGYFRVRAGSNFYTKEGNVRTVEETYLYPSLPLLTSYYNNNIGILKVTKPFILSQTIQTIPMVGKHVIIPDHELATLARWGDSDNKLKDKIRTTSVVIETQRKCENYISKIEDFSVVRLESIYCASMFGPKHEFNNYYGGYGSPLVYNGTLIGVSSIDINDTNHLSIGSVFMNVGYYRGWIRDFTRQN